MIEAWNGPGRGREDVQKLHGASIARDQRFGIHNRCDLVRDLQRVHHFRQVSIVCGNTVLPDLCVRRRTNGKILGPRGWPTSTWRASASWHECAHRTRGACRERTKQLTSRRPAASNDASADSPSRAGQRARQSPGNRRLVQRFPDPSLCDHADCPDRSRLPCSGLTTTMPRGRPLEARQQSRRTQKPAATACALGGR